MYVCVCVPVRVCVHFESGSHQFVHLHQLLLLLVELFVFDIQHHLETLQLLLQVEGVSVLLQGPVRMTPSQKERKEMFVFKGQRFVTLKTPQEFESDMSSEG